MLKIYSGVGRGPLELFIKQLLEILALRSGIFFTSKWTNWWKKPHQTTPETFSETFTSLTLAAENPDQCRSGATTQAEQGPALPCAMAPTNGSKGKLRHSQQGKASTKKLCKRSSPQFWCLVFECQKIQLPARFSCTVSTVTILV